MNHIHTKVLILHITLATSIIAAVLAAAQVKVTIEYEMHPIRWPLTQRSL